MVFVFDSFTSFNVPMCIWSLTDSRRLVAERILQILVQQHRWFTVWFDWQNSLSRFSLVIRSSVFICIKLNQCICYWSELKLPFCFTLSRYKFTFQQIYLYAKPIVNIFNIITVLSLSRTFTTCLAAEKLLNHILMADFLNTGSHISVLTNQFRCAQREKNRETTKYNNNKNFDAKTSPFCNNLFVAHKRFVFVQFLCFSFSFSTLLTHIDFFFFLLLIKKLW